MGDYWFVLVLCSAIMILMWGAYKSGYRKGALMVLDSWKQTIQEMENDRHGD